MCHELRQVFVGTYKIHNENLQYGLATFPEFIVLNGTPLKNYIISNSS